MGSSTPSNPNESESPERARRAEAYFHRPELLDGQNDWYDRRASKNKRWNHTLAIVIVAAGALIAVIQLWAPDPPDTPVHWTAAITALLGAIVVIAKGIERIWDFDGTWTIYRQSSEAMKHERRSYLTGTGAYRELDDEAAYLLFVERVEAIIAEESHAYWSARPGGEQGSDGD